MYTHCICTTYFYSEKPFWDDLSMSVYLLAAISELLVYAIFIFVVLPPNSQCS